MGDWTGYVTKWLRTEAHFADLVVTLSKTVADHLLTLQIARRDNTRILFHPDLSYGSARANRERNRKEALRLLFFGRIRRYKGLTLLLDALELLMARGLYVHLGVAGEGDVSRERQRLATLGAEVTNRWLADGEIGPLLARYDAMVLPYMDASQSGVAATAFGNCMPVIGVPVGGLTEQIIDGRTGVLASQVSARSLADAIQRLAVDDVLYRNISAHLNATMEDRSMRRFIHEIVGAMEHGK
jgi:glycosyltransferase involved in cell wall biosynthesis